MPKLSSIQSKKKNIYTQHIFVIATTGDLAMIKGVNVNKANNKLVLGVGLKKCISET